MTQSPQHYTLFETAIGTCGVAWSEGGLVAVHKGTPMQARNETDVELVFFAYGAPTEHGNAEFVEDVETL